MVEIAVDLLDGLEVFFDVGENLVDTASSQQVEDEDPYGQIVNDIEVLILPFRMY